MSFKVQVGPPQISIHQGQTVLVSEADGQVPWQGPNGDGVMVLVMNGWVGSGA